MNIAEIQNRIADLVADTDARSLWRVRLAEYDTACRQAYDTTTAPPADDSEDTPDGWPDAWQPWLEGHGDSKSTTWRRRGPNNKIDQYVRNCREGRGWSVADAMVTAGHPAPRPADDRERLLIAYAALTVLHDQCADRVPLAPEEWPWAPSDIEPLTTSDRGRGMVCSWLSDVERDIEANTAAGQGGNEQPEAADATEGAPASVKPSQLRAYFGYLWVCGEKPDLIPDGTTTASKAMYRYLSANKSECPVYGKDHDVPTFESWKSQIRAGRGAVKDGKVSEDLARRVVVTKDDQDVAHAMSMIEQLAQPQADDLQMDHGDRRRQNHAMRDA